MELAIFEATICRNKLIGVDTKAIDFLKRSGNSSRAEEMHESVHSLLIVDVETEMLAYVIKSRCACLTPKTKVHTGQRLFYEY